MTTSTKTNTFGIYLILITALFAGIAIASVNSVPSDGGLGPVIIATSSSNAPNVSISTSTRISSIIEISSSTTVVNATLESSASLPSATAPPASSSSDLSSGSSQSGASSTVSDLPSQTSNSAVGLVGVGHVHAQGLAAVVVAFVGLVL